MEENAIPEQLMVGLAMTLRSARSVPSHVAQIPLGGPVPTIIISMDMENYAEGKMMMNVDATGFEDAVDLITVLEGVVEHIKTTSFDVIDDNGVTHVDPIEAPEGDG